MIRHVYRRAVLMMCMSTAFVAVVSANPPSGAIFTTVADGSEVNFNIYPNKEAVYLDGGPGPGARPRRRRQPLGQGLAAAHRSTTVSSRSKTTPSSAAAVSMNRSSIVIRWPRPMHSGWTVSMTRPPGACSWA